MEENFRFVDRFRRHCSTVADNRNWSHYNREPMNRDKDTENRDSIAGLDEDLLYVVHVGVDLVGFPVITRRNGR